jgi:hypothetical protein
VYEESPPWFWTAAELAESAFFLATTVTDPDGARSARSDEAARAGANAMGACRPGSDELGHLGADKLLALGRVPWRLSGCPDINVHPVCSNRSPRHQGAGMPNSPWRPWAAWPRWCWLAAGRG